MSTHEQAAGLREKIDKILNNSIVNRHSLFQLKYFVVGREPTHQRRMWRCLEELKVRRDGLDGLLFQMAETSDDLALAEVELRRMDLHHEESDIPNDKHRQLFDQEHTIKRRKLVRKVKHMEDSQARLRQTFDEQNQEAEFFVRTFEALNKQEKLKPFDDFDSQLEYYNERYAQLLNMKVLLQLPLDTELVQCALALPETSSVRKQVVSLLDNQHKQLAALKRTEKEVEQLVASTRKSE